MAEVTQYFRTSDGVLASRTTSGAVEEPPPLPEGATPLTEEEYTDELAAVEAARQEHAEELVAEDTANTRTDYLALLDTGVPEASARRMSGYTGPAIEPESGQ
ncbi:hypothetical protein [Streptomyces sp. MNU103]|uniref:hypothetical protein n=1 Tax=Streptomyces sp. MNU103 TaxID=2560024 RepID=UPI001E4E92AB|nr:hypothetical protein [Streptomyces sp. MNU103]